MLKIDIPGRSGNGTTDGADDSTTQIVLHTASTGFDILWGAVGEAVKADPQTAAIVTAAQLLHAGAFTTLESLVPGADPEKEVITNASEALFGQLGRSLITGLLDNGTLALTGFEAGAATVLGSTGIGLVGGALIAEEYKLINDREGDIINFFVQHGTSPSDLLNFLQTSVSNSAQSFVDAAQADVSAALGNFALAASNAHGDTALLSQDLLNFQSALVTGLTGAAEDSIDFLGMGAIDTSSIHAQIAAALQGDSQDLSNLFAGALGAVTSDSAAMSSATATSQALNSYIGANLGSLSADIATAGGVEMAVSDGQPTTLLDGITLQANDDGSLFLSAPDQSDPDTLINDDGSAVMIREGIAGDTWKEISDNYNQFVQLTNELQTNLDGGTIASTFDPGHGDKLSSVLTTNPDNSSSLLQNDLSGGTWQAFTESFDPDGQLTENFQINKDTSTSDTVYDPAQADAVRSIFTVAIDGSSTFTQFGLGSETYQDFVNSFDPHGQMLEDLQTNKDGSTVDELFDPTHDDALSSVRTVDADGSSTFVQDDLTGQNWNQSTDTFNTDGQLTQQFQVNDDGTSTDEVFDPTKGGALVSTFLADSGNASSFTQYDLDSDHFDRFTNTFDGDGNLIGHVQINNDGSSIAQTFDPDSGVVTQETVINPDGSMTRNYYAPDGTWLHTIAFDGDGEVVSESLNPAISPQVQFASVIDALAGQAISEFLFKNNLPASLAAQAFVHSSLSSLVNGIGDQPLGDPATFLGAYATQLATMAAGVLGTDAGQDLFKAVGLDSKPELIVGGLVGKTAATDLSNYVIFNINALITGAATESLETAFETFDGSIETAGVTALASYLESLLGTNRIGPGAAIGGTIGSIIGTAIGTVFGVPLLGSFIGDFIGSLIGGLFGGHPSVGPNAVAFDEYNTTTRTFGLTASGADNGGDVQIARDMVNAEAGDENMLIKAIGGHVVGTVQPNSLGYFKGTFFYAPGKVNPDPFPNTFANASGAVDFAVVTTLKGVTIQGGDPFMEYALLKSAATTAAGLASDLNAAYDFSAYIADPLAFDAALAISNNATQFQAWMAELAEAKALGLDHFTITGTNTVSISDTAAHIIANMPLLLKLGSQLSATVVTDTAANILAKKSALLNLIAAHEVTSLAIADTAANISANFTALQTLISGGQLKAVSVTDSATHVVTGMAMLETLASEGVLTSLALTDTSVPAFTLSIAQIASNAPLLARFVSSYEIAVADSAANVLAGLDALQAIAAQGRLASISFSDTGAPTLAITAAQYANDIGTLDKIGNNFDLTISGALAGDAANLIGQAHVMGFSVQDTASDVAANLGALEQAVSSARLTAIALTDAGTPALAITETALNADGAALGKIAGPYNLAVSNVLAADAAQVASHAHVSSFGVTDTAADILANATGLGTLLRSGVLSSVVLADTSTTVKADITSLESLAAAGKLSAIVFTDGGIPTLSLSEARLSLDVDVLNAITSRYQLVTPALTIVLGDNAHVDILNSNRTIIPGFNDTIGIMGQNDSVMIDRDDGIVLLSKHGIADPLDPLGANALVGDAGDNVIGDTAGVNVMIGGAGSDTFVAPGMASGGTVTVWGGTRAGASGVDAVDYSNAAAGLQIVLGQGHGAGGITGWVADNNSHYLAALNGIDNAFGGAGNDAITGNADDNLIAGGGGNNWLAGGAGNDTFTAPGAGGGTDTVWGGSVSGASGVDTVDYSSFTGDLQINMAAGTGAGGAMGNVASNDRLLANLHGISNVVGGSGNDIFADGLGSNAYTGGAGSDRFVFGHGGGFDTIADFAPSGAAADAIELDGYGIQSFAALQALMVQQGGDTVIVLSATDHITLQHIQMSQLTAGDFIFG